MFLTAFFLSPRISVLELAPRCSLRQTSAPSLLVLAFLAHLSIILQEAALSLELVSDLLTPACWLVCFSLGNRAPSSWSTLPGPAFCPRGSSGAIYGKKFPWIWDLGVPQHAQAPCPCASSPSAQIWRICRGHTEVGGRARPAPRVCQGLHLHGPCRHGCSHQQLPGCVPVTPGAAVSFSSV